MLAELKKLRMDSNTQVRQSAVHTWERARKTQ